jgi:hypothetical protein
VGRQDRHGPFGHLGHLVDEDRTLRLEVAHDVEVVDDLLAHVDGRAVLRERALDRLDGALDAGAVATRCGEQDGSHAPMVAMLCVGTVSSAGWVT